MVVITTLFNSKFFIISVTKVTKGGYKLSVRLVI